MKNAKRERAKTMIRIIIASLFIAVSLSTYAIAQDGHEGHDHSQHAGKPELIITPITPNVLKVGEENEVVLFIQDKQAKPVDVSQFEMVHTQPVHLLIIEPGFSDYHHEHPVQRTTGQYAFSITPKTACSYRVWVDVQPKGSHQQYIPVDLKGVEECNEPIDKVVDLEASSQGYNFKLEPEGDLKVGEAVFANINITKDGQPVDFLEPVMGAFAHMVGFYEDYESIAHIHPIGIEPTQDTERGGPTLRFHIEPKQAGYLKLFAQVQIDGKQVFSPFRITIQNK